MSGPLEGIRVIDLTVYAFGPRAAEYLAEMGAEVIKVESPQGGDPLRAETGKDLRGIIVGPFNSYFEQIQRGKKSIAMDLHYEEARAAMYKLVESSDVFVSNLRMGGLERLGMDYETLSRINPRLIYAIGTGWGLKGPARDRGAFEATGFARSALVTNFVERGARPPLCPPAFGDYCAATMLAYGIMLALYNRERTGEGQMVHASLLGSFMKLISCCIDASLAEKQDMLGLAHERDNPLYSIYQTKDNRWLQIALVQDYRGWNEFCGAVGLEHIMDDPRFGTPEARVANRPELVCIMDELFLTRTLDEWVEILENYQFPWAPIRNFTELESDPQVLANDYLVTLDDTEIGEVKVVGVNVDLSKTPGRVGSKAPELGQHTEEILLELGYEWDDIIAMKETGSIL